VKKTVHRSFRFTWSDLTRWQKQAKANGVSFSEWVRQALDAHAASRHRERDFLAVTYARPAQPIAAPAPVPARAPAAVPTPASSVNIDDWLKPMTLEELARTVQGSAVLGIPPAPKFQPKPREPEPLILDNGMIID
jgi:hypothetical protein